MKVRISPGRVRGTMKASPSKSVAHRLLLCAGLSGGTSVIHGISDSEDMKATLDCLSAVGAVWTKEGETVTIRGTDIRKLPAHTALRCRESGSTLRFFIPLCLLSGQKVSCRGSETLLARPLEVYQEICERQGLLFAPGREELVLAGPLQSGNYRVKGNISSQFISGLLFALPLREADSTIQLLPPVESCSYIDLTLQALRLFGVRAEWQEERTLFIPGGQSYQPREAEVEGDYSNAAFFAALNTLGSQVNIEGLNPDSHQGDRIYEHFFSMLAQGTPTIHIADCPDLGPILFAVAAAKNGGVFTGTRRLRIKESDRAAAMAEELAKFGVAVTVRENSVVVYPAEFHAPTEPLNGHNDHRIVMALATLLTLVGGELTGAEAVAKSMPDYFEKLSALGFEVTCYDA